MGRRRRLCRSPPARAGRTSDPAAGQAGEIRPGRDWFAGNAADYDRLRLSLGVPDGSRDLPVEKAILLENGFDELHGIDWQKGCYMGQELTARTRYRGLVRKRLLPVDDRRPAARPRHARDGRRQGGRRDAQRRRRLGLALLRLEHLDEGAAALPATAGSTPHKPALGELLDHSRQRHGVLMGRARLRDLGITVGQLPPGPLNAITDVAGVRVGHATVIHDDAARGAHAASPRSGRGGRDIWDDYRLRRLPLLQRQWRDDRHHLDRRAGPAGLARSASPTPMRSASCATPSAPTPSSAACRRPGICRWWPRPMTAGSAMPRAFR